MLDFLAPLGRAAHRVFKRRFPYEPLITIEISRSALIHNLMQFAKLAPRDPQTGRAILAPVLKSNAYGHGLYEVASILEHRGLPTVHIPFFIVDSYFEAIALRSKGIHTQLLIIGYSRPDTIIHSRLKNVAFTVTSLETLRELALSNRHVHIHLKVDTGMHRQGILVQEVDEALNILKRSPHIHFEGVCSHMSDADAEDPGFSLKQVETWNELAGKIHSLVKWLHLSATFGHRYHSSIQATVSRPGIGLYGLADGDTFKPKLDLKPVLEMKTIITGLKQVRAGETVGYNNTFKATKDMLVATIPVGYYEGLNRQLSNSGTLLVGPKRITCPIVGRVSMNITTIDVSNTPEAKIGTEVLVISNKNSDPNSIMSMAKKYDRISYELAVNIPAHLRRTITK